MKLGDFHMATEFLVNPSYRDMLLWLMLCLPEPILEGLHGGDLPVGRLVNLHQLQFTANLAHHRLW